LTGLTDRFPASPETITYGLARAKIGVHTGPLA
jgi:hypothetical protein